MSALAWWADLPRDRFGDTPAMNDDLAALVIAGRKTASCSAKTHYDPATIAPGVRSVIENGSGEPVCVIETISIECRRFDEVDEILAQAEGEGDLTLAYWRQAHRGFFEREGSFSPDMELVCERFRLIEVLPGASQ